MINLSFSVKNKKYSLNVEKGQDILLALDNFIKNNKLEFTCFKDVKIRCLGPKASPTEQSSSRMSHSDKFWRDSVSCRIGKIIAFVLNKA